MDDFMKYLWASDCRNAKRAVQSALTSVNFRILNLSPIDNLEEYEYLKKSRAALLQARDALKIFRENKP